ncbi:hypothetical protein PSMK_10910 [Phycisphaera mikurensis NBRC 102666]|uniref:Exosortase n=1 Tax=Phycisphaera mikurensis (strain NBRC 102666 / KCTC 22515 / FYK2301M01) TaxID=1142394 RepID=I0IDB2_PHYMF|nr:hypothetical protein PSMK_10910 [Phycisphaera mikurensis NBRC 102666]
MGLTLVGLAVTACYRAFADILYIAVRDEEASQVLLVPFVIGWLCHVRWTAIQRTRPAYDFAGPAVIAAGLAVHLWGGATNLQVAWHGGAVLCLLGAITTVAGRPLLWRIWPAVLVLAFLVPVPGIFRQQLAMPLQEYTAAAAEFVFTLLGLGVERSGNMLVYNGHPVMVAEACNGMRMMFALVLVAYAFAFGTPLLPSVRVMLLVLSPVAAVLTNIIRVVPTVILYGHYPDVAAGLFHDLAGWAMLAVAFCLLLMLVRTLKWADVPVMAPRTNLATA